MYLKNFIFILLMLAGISRDGLAQAGFTKVAEVEGISEYKLNKNGMKVLLFPDNSKPTITVNQTYLVGSRNEDYGETGMAHLLEHLLFKGTPDHPNIPEELTKHGARANGTTWLDRTNYFETFQATDDNLNWALSMEADRMVNSFIAKKDLVSEMTVVRNEFEMGENDPESILGERVLSTAFLWHNYGNSTIGARSDIEEVPIERLQNYYKKYYQPDNTVLIVSGKIDVNKTLDLIKKYYEAIPVPDRSGRNKIYDTYTREPVQDGERMVTLNRVGDKQAINIAYHICSGADPDMAPLDMLVSMLTDDPSGVLYKKLTEPKKVSNVYGYTFDLKEPGVMIFGASIPMDKSLSEAKSILLGQLDSVPMMKFDQKDLDRQKDASQKQWQLMFNNVERIGTVLSEYVAKGDWRLLFLSRDNVEKVTMEDVYRVANKYFKSSNRTVGVFIPDKNPSRTEINNDIVVADLVKDYKGREKINTGEDFDASPANIDSRTMTSVDPSGIKMAFLPKETRGDQVTAVMTFRIGNLDKLKGKATIASFTGDMLNKGSKTMTKQEIQDAFDKLKSNVSISGGATQFSVRITTVHDNLAPTIELVKSILREPAFPENEFEILKTQTIAEIEAQKSEPNSLASIEFGKIMRPYPKDDPRYTASLDEEMAAAKEVTLNDVKKFYKDFYGASDMTVAVVGDFDKPQIEKTIKNSFTGWKSMVPYKRIENKYVAIAPTEKAINTPDKANSLYLSGIAVEMNDKSPDYAAVMVGNYILGGGFLNSRLATRIRQKDGLSYGVGSGFNASPLDNTGMMTVYAISAPENTSKVANAVKEEIARVNKEGFTAEELKLAKEGLMQSWQVARAQDNSLAGTLNNNLFLNRSLKFDADMEKAVEGLTLEQVNKAFNKYVTPSKLVVITAGDFDKVKANKP